MFRSVYALIIFRRIQENAGLWEMLLLLLKYMWNVGGFVQRLDAWGDSMGLWGYGTRGLGEKLKNKTEKSPSNFFRY